MNLILQTVLDVHNESLAVSLAPSSADVTVTAGGHVHDFTTAAASSLPSHYEVVWVMRVK